MRTREEMLGYDGDKKLLGLFNKGNMTTAWTGARAATPRSGPQRCDEAHRPANEPTLAEMTREAIHQLDRSQGPKGKGRAKGKPGFFLQVEAASIDKQDHAANPCAQIGETVAFDKAIQAGLAYARQHEDTSVIVTADHSHTSQVIPQTTNSPGKTSTLIGKDATPGQTTCEVPEDDRASSAPGCITVNYATSTGGSQTHTGHTVRVGGVGPQAANLVGLVDQTDLFRIMSRAIGPK